VCGLATVDIVLTSETRPTHRSGALSTSNIEATRAGLFHSGIALSRFKWNRGDRLCRPRCLGRPHSQRQQVESIDAQRSHSRFSSDERTIAGRPHGQVSFCRGAAPTRPNLLRPIGCLQLVDVARYFPCFELISNFPTVVELVRGGCRTALVVLGGLRRALRHLFRIWTCTFPVTTKRFVKLDGRTARFAAVSRLGGTKSSV
jgi:hypothetical protein